MWPVFKNTIMTIIARKANIINQPASLIMYHRFHLFSKFGEQLMPYVLYIKKESYLNWQALSNKFIKQLFVSQYMSTPFLIGEEKISLSKFFSFLITYKSVSLSIWENSSLLPFTPLPNTYIICNIFMRKFFMYSKVPFPPHHILGLCSLTMFSYYVLVLCPYTISLYHISMPYPYTMSLCHVIVLWLYTMSLPVPITSSLPIFPSIGPLCDGEKISHYIFILTFNSSLFSPYGRMCQRTRERAAGKWTDGSGEIWRFFRGATVT